MQDLAVIPEHGNGLALEPTPLVLLQQAIAQGVSIEVLERFQAMYERSQDRAAHMAFAEAMSKFKSESILILRDKHNSQYDSKYVSLGNLVNTVTPFLSKHGLSATWDVNQDNGIKVTCIIKHAMGHSESVSMIVPPDDSGKKNPIQQIKSAITYAKGCTFESACGLASTDGNVSDDGNGASGMDDVSERIEFIHNCRDFEELKRVFGEAYKRAKSLKDNVAEKKIIAAYEQRKRELNANR